MVSIEGSFNMLNRHLNSDSEDFARYPDPPQTVFSSAPLDMSVPAGSYTPYSAAQDAYHPTTMAYDPTSLYAEAPSYMYNSRSSPGHFHDDGDMRAASSNLSTASAHSAASSAAASPQSNHGQLAPVPQWAPQGLDASPGIVGHNDYFPAGTEYSTFAPGMDEFAPYDFHSAKAPGFVDPSHIHPEINRPMPIAFDGTYQTTNAAYPTSPALSHSASSPRPMMRNGSQSPFLHGGFQQSFSPYQTPMDSSASRRPSHPFVSPTYTESTPFGSEDPKEKSRCPHPECGKSFKDLKAHMLTHQTERPEKCPIQTCDYHTKGFSRKYDRNRHTLTHYKGTMVCGFCPGTGSAAEKSFNRADVFKRHLTAVHGVEQTPPNSRKKTPTSVAGGKRLSGYPPDATGKCSTCSQTFANAQEFYEHLDDCVLRIVQQEDPAEAVNAMRLAEVQNDHDVIQTLEKNHLPLTTTTPGAEDNGEDDDDDDMANDDYDSQEEDSRGSKGAAARRKSSGNPANGVQKSRGMTHSRGGVALTTRRGRKNRRDYPSSWGFDKGQMTMKKRVMAVFEGPRRLAKDDMMLSTEHEVRVGLPDGKSYVTDLDVQTLKRAEGFLGATEEEKGPWISDDPTEEDLEQMREMLQGSQAASA